MGTVKDIDLGHELSSPYPFFQNKHQNDNNMVDGRQMGTAIVHPTAQISQGVFLGEQVEVEQGVTIYPGTVVMGRCRIGTGTTLYSNVSINSDVIIGTGCRIHSNTVIGSDGFGYNFRDGQHLKVWHLGGVVIGDDVEMGANCSIDRGSFKNTVIGSGCKLDNAVHVAHNCIVGKSVIFCAQSALSGSVRTDDFVVFGGRVGVLPDVHLGSGCMVSAGTIVTESWPAGSRLGGFYSMNHWDWIRGLAIFKKLAKKPRDYQQD